MKLGSLFDGIGGFPLAGSRHGIKPVWASEIEPGPMAITKKHFPDMVHLGDVTKINGADVEPVDVITFGSPCQDLSVAGKRAGLDGARSGLFMEAIRIIKEMRDATDGPRFAVWENVPGAFSSNSGEDFRVVLEELCRVKDPTFTVPSSKWEPAGLVEGDGWSVAWRVLDAQYWGVPQRRKRIFVVADFAGGSAGQILFERESLRRDFAAGEGAGQGTAADAARGAGTEEGFDGYNQLSTGKVSKTLNCSATDYSHIPLTLAVRGRGDESNLEYRQDGTANALLTPNGGRAGIGVGAVAYAVRMREGCEGGGKGPLIQTDKSGTSATGNDQTIFQPIGFFAMQAIGEHKESSSSSLKQRDYKDATDLVVEPIRRGYKVRRLTPTECERLQGFPDGWTEGFPDTVRYKALGNSVAVPCVEFVMEGLIGEWMLS